MIATFDHWNEVLQATNVSMNSAGTAEEKYADYMGSIDAKINQFIATWEQFVNNLNGSDAFAGIIDLGIKLIEVLDTLINKWHIIEKFVFPVAVGVGIGKLLKSADKLITWIAQVKDMSAVFNKMGTDTKKLGQALQLYSDKQKILILSTRQLTKAQQLEVLEASGMTEKARQQAVSTTLLTNAQNGATLSTHSLGAAFRSLGSAFLSNPIGIMITAITTLISVITLFSQAQEESRQKAEDAAVAYEENTKAITEYKDEIQKLRKEIDDGNLTIEEEREKKERLIEIENELVEKYGQEAKSINLVNGEVKEQLGLLDQLSRKDASEFLTSNKKDIDTAIKKMQEGKNYYLGGISKDNIKFKREVLDKYSDKGITVDDVGSRYVINFTGNAEDAKNVLNDLESDIRNFKQNNGEIFGDALDIEEQVGKQFEKAKSTVEKYGEIYEQALLAKIVDSDKLAEPFEKYTEDIEKYNQAVQEHARAIASGNEEEINRTMAALEVARKEQLSSMTEVRNIASEIMPEILPVIDDVANGVDKSALSFAEFYDSFEKSYKDSLAVLKNTKITSEQISSGMKTSSEEQREAYNDLLYASKQYGISEQQLLQILIEKGYVIDNSIKSIQRLTEETDKYVESAKNIQDAYVALSDVASEYNSTGTLTIDTIDKLLDVDKEYLKYLELENGQLVINKEAMIQLAQSKLQDAIASEQAYIAEQKQAQAGMINEFVTNKVKDASYNLEQQLNNESEALQKNSQDMLANAEAAMASAQARAAEEGINLDELYDSQSWKDIQANIDAAYDRIGLYNDAILNVGNSFTSAANSGKSTTDAWKEEFEKTYKDLQYQRDMDLIDAKTYYTQLAALNQKYFADREKYLDDFRKYNKEVYQGLKNLEKEEFEKLYKDLQYQRNMDLIDEKTYLIQLSSLNEKYFAGKEKYLDDYRKYNEEVYQGLKKLEEERLKAEAQAEIDSIDEKIDKLQEEKSALKEKNEEEDKALQLQKAKDRYEAAKGQLVNRVFTKEQGWIWQVDTKELEDAKEEMENIQKEIDLSNAEKAIDDQISELEKLKDKWQEYMDNISVELEELGFDISENGDIAVENSEVAEQSYDKMSDSVKNYATSVNDSAYSVENSIGKINTALNSIGSMNIELTSTKYDEFFKSITGDIYALKLALALCSPSAQNFVDKLKELDNFATTSKMVSFINDLGEEAKTAFKSIGDNLNNINIEVIDNIVTRITDGFKQIAESIDNHTKKMRNAAINDAFNFLQMSISAQGFATSMKNVEQKVSDSLDNIKIAAEAAVSACQTAEDAALRAEDAAVKAIQSAQSALESARDAERYADAAAESARDAEMYADRASNQGGGEEWFASGIEKGVADFTGLAMLHGTPNNPEYVLTSNQMQNFVRNMSRNIPSGKFLNTRNETTNNNNDGDVVIKGCTFQLNNVREPVDFMSALKQIAKQNRR